MKCGVIITTRNRKEDLHRTCAVLAAMQPPPDEVIICADGCTDGTVEFVREAHPGFRLLINDTACGSIASRDKMMRASDCDLLLSLDDDSYPMEIDFFAKLPGLFVRRPQLAVAAFPQHSDEFPETLTLVDFGPPQFVGSFSNAGAAIRRSVFLELGGYPAYFRHAYEEPDFALRCVAAGFEVRFEPSLHIRHHFTAVQRNEMRVHQSHARNELWSVLMRCPFPHLIPVIGFRLCRQFAYACKRGWRWALAEPRWWIACLAGVFRATAQRKPLPWAVYRNWMRLVRSPIVSELDWQKKFGSKRGIVDIVAASSIHKG